MRGEAETAAGRDPLLTTCCSRYFSKAACKQRASEGVSAGALLAWLLVREERTAGSTTWLFVALGSRQVRLVLGEGMCYSVDERDRDKLVMKLLRRGAPFWAMETSL